MVGIPAPSFDTHRVSEILRRLKQYKIVSKKGVPYRRVYIKGDLNTLNTCANRELGAGGYTISQFHEDWYYIGLREQPVKSNRGWPAGVPRGPKEKEMPVFALLSTKWVDNQGESYDEH